VTLGSANAGESSLTSPAFASQGSLHARRRHAMPRSVLVETSREICNSGSVLPALTIAILGSNWNGTRYPPLESVSDIDRSAASNRCITTDSQCYTYPYAN
jgi:hypothetical protein